jgi:4-amino-4-deoxy-L-arabinose transferase-like glycosyltransferase
MEELDLKVADKPLSNWRRDAGLLLVLILLAAGLRTWQITHTEVAARDSISFVRYAWQLEHQPLSRVLREGEHHPGYPAAVWLVSQAVRHFDHRPMSEVMELSAQLASALASLLLVLPIFYIGKELFDHRVGFWTCLLFQCLPASSRVLADGLTEALFLLFAVSALVFAIRALRGDRALPFVLCGVCSGLAYLTRPEGALIGAITGIGLLVMQIRRSQRRPWPRFVACGLGLVLASLALAGPFVAVTGKLTTKPSANRLTSPNPEGTSSRLIVSGPLAGRETISQNPNGWTGGPLFAIWRGFNEDLDRQSGKDVAVGRFWWSVYALGFDLGKGYFYVFWLPVLIGLWWFRDRFRCEPGALVMLLVNTSIVLLLWRVAVVIGYASDRHLLLPILCGLYWGTAALLDVPQRLGRFFNSQRWLAIASRLFIGTAEVPQRLGRFFSRQRWLPVAALVLIAVAALPKSLETIHGDRAGFREAGLWLAQHMEPTDVVLDPYCWAYYFAGQVFEEVTPTPPPPDSHRTAYVVLEHGQSEHIRLTLVDLCKKCSEKGQIVYRAHPARRGRKPVDVEVYALPLSDVNRIKAGELHAAR